jgi:fimbrial isopeptide formation D2 family protein
LIRSTPRAGPARSTRPIWRRPISSNVSGVDAGDIVSFAIAIENTGSSLKGAFDILLRDDLPAPYQIPGSGLNLQIYYGNGGGPIAYLGQGGGPDGLPGTPDDLFGVGIQLVDPVGQGVCQAHDPNSGNNIILITYDLQLGNTTGPGTVINTASLVHYAGDEGGPNHLPVPQTDTAETTILGTAAKDLVSTEIDNAVNALAQAVIGELVTYRLTLTVPEGTTPDAQIVDTLDPGLAFVRVESVTLSTDLTAENAIGTGPAPANVTIGGSGGTITFNPGDLTNVNRDNAVAETLEIIYTAVVLNGVGNQSGTRLNNSAVHSWNGGALPAVSAPDVTVIEPVLAVDKTAVVNGLGNSGDAGDPIVYTITLQHAGTSQTDAFDLLLSDALPQAAGGQSLIAGATLASVVDSGWHPGPRRLHLRGQ